MFAAAAGAFESAKLLMESEGGLQDSRGCTALMLAAYAGNLDVV